MSNNEEWGNIELPGISDKKLLSTNWNRVAAGLENKYNEKLLDLAEQKANDPMFSNTMKAVAAKRDEQYFEALNNGIANRNNLYQAEVNSRPEVRAKHSQNHKGRKKTAEHEAKIAASNKQKANDPAWKSALMAGLAKRDRQFHAGPYGVFPSLNAAARSVTEQGLLKNAVKKFEKWKVDYPDEYYFIETM
jgi:hypothetical protein